MRASRCTERDFWRRRCRASNATTNDLPPCPGAVMSLRRILPFAILSSVALSSTAFAGTKLLRFPDVCGDKVVFTYAGDLWLASTQGGTATRLTAGPGLEQSARFSPDCSRIAFTGEYGGDDQLYV